MDVAQSGLLHEPLGGALDFGGSEGAVAQDSKAMLPSLASQELRNLCFCFTSGANQFLGLGISFSEYERMLWSQFPRKVAHPGGVPEARSIASLFLSSRTPLTLDNNNNYNNNNNVGFDLGEVNVQYIHRTRN